MSEAPSPHVAPEMRAAITQRLTAIEEGVSGADGQAR